MPRHRVLIPRTARGQGVGTGAAAADGAAFYESFEYADDGSFLSGTFADYLVPTACEVPEPEILHMETPSPFTPLGAKGAAEGNNMTTPVCLANAVCDALGVTDIDLPLTPARLSEIIHGDEPPPPSGRTAKAAQRKAAGAALEGSGATFVPAPPQQVWDTLLDPAKLAAVIPGCQALDLVGDNDYRATVSLGVGPVRGRFEAQVKISDLDPPAAATLSGGLGGPLGSSAGSGQVRLSPADGGTRVTYDYTVEIGGKVAAVGGRMLEGAAKVVVDQFFARLAAQVAGAPAESWWRQLLRKLGL